MGYVSPIEVAKAELIREGTHTGKLMEFLEREAITDPAVVATSIEGETDFIERTEKLLMIEGELRAKGAGLKDYIKVLQGRLKQYEDSADSIREGVKIAFERARMPKISTCVGTVSAKANPLGATVVNEEAVPPEFFSYKLNETAAKKAAVERETARRRIGEVFMSGNDILEGQEVAMILALWDFDLDNPEITGVEVDAEVSYTIQVRRS